MDPTIRSATRADAPSIPALMRGERVNPTGIDWRRFVLAERDEQVIGCVQLRPAGPDAVEVGSLVVRRDLRRQGLGGRLVQSAAARAGARRVLAVVPAARIPWWEGHGIRRISLAAAPWRVGRNLILGQAGSLIALAHGLRPRRLAILERL